MPSMPTEDRLGELLLRWDDLRRQGRDLPADELCTDCPELAGELRRRIEVVRGLDPVLEVEPGDMVPAPGEGGPDGLGSDRRLPDDLHATAVYLPQRIHAQGGLGEVLTARQMELDRTVALKRIRPGKLHAGTRRRFLREAAITARLQHPGIVPIYGLGRDDDGPFYTMPFIHGQTLQQAIEGYHGGDASGHDVGTRILKLRGLLQHFIAVCNTVAYAHDQGVVHRDLKPSNIMLGSYGETLVMDWGLAKSFAADGPEIEAEEDAPSPSPSPGNLTATGAVLGTPQYMSPEQAQGRPAGPSSDIFSLGLILYAVLTGRPPYDETTLRGADPLKPVREAAIVPLRSRDPTLARPLEAVCLKAVAAQPRDRYSSGRELARELENWLADEAVSAWREPLVRRAQRWARRNRTAVTGAAVAVLAGVVGLLALAAVQSEANRRLQDERDNTARALIAETKATRETETALAQKGEALAQSEESRKRAEAVLTFLKEDVLAVARPEGLMGGLGVEVTVRKALGAAESKIADRFKGQPLAEAALRSSLGETFYYLAENRPAIRQFQGALELRRAQLGPDHPDTLTERNNLAVAYLAAGLASDAAPILEGVLKLREARLGPDHPDTLISRNSLAMAYHNAGRLAEALRMDEETLRLYTARLGPDHPDTLKSRNNLALDYQAAGRPAEAVRLHEKTLKLREARFGPDHPDTLNSRNSLARAYHDAGRTAEAIAMHEATLKLRESKLGPDHSDTLRSRNNLAAAYLDAGRTAEAIAMHEATLKLRESRLGPDHPNTLNSRNNLAAAYYAAGRAAEALRVQEGTLRLFESKLGPDHPDTLMSRNNLAIAYRAAGRTTEAIGLLTVTLRLRESKLGPDHAHTFASRYELAGAYESLGRWADAEVQWRDTLIRRRKAGKADSPLLAGDLAMLGWNLLNQANWSEAEQVLRECFRIRAKAVPDDWTRFNTMSQLGGSLVGQKRYVEAEPLVVPGYEGMKARETKIPATAKPRLLEAAERVIWLYEAWGKPEQATAWRARLGLTDLPKDAFAQP
jgi:serine/threonine protein kinase